MKPHLVSIPLEQVTPRSRRRFGLVTASRLRAALAGAAVVAATLGVCFLLLAVAVALGMLWR